MSRAAQDNLVAVLLLALFGGVIWLCQDFGPRARMIPLPLAVFGIVLTLAQLAWQNLRSTDELQMDMIRVQEPVVAEAEAEMPKAAALRPATFGRELAATGLVALLLGLVYLIGVIPAVFVFTGGYFLVSRQYGVLAALLYTTAFTVVIYLLFIVALQVRPYYGLLQPFIDPIP